MIAGLKRLALAGLCTVFLAGCGGNSQRDALDTLRIGLGGEPRDLDPHTTTGNLEGFVFNGLLEGLVTYHPTDDSIPCPGTAESWETSADGLVWRFKIRQDARWSNGDPVTADDFVYSWKRALSPQLGCFFAYTMYGIVGAEAYHKGELHDFSEVGILAEDDKVLKVVLSEPLPEFLTLLLNRAFLPVHPPTIEAHGGPAVFASGWTAPGRFVGNGPYQLVKWEPNSFIRMERNPFYWDAKLVRMDAIQFYPISDENTELRTFESGQLHVTATVPSTMQEYYRKNHPERIRFDPSANAVFLRINATRPPLDDVRVRKALSLAVDREQLVRALLHGNQRIATSLVPDGLDGYEAPPGEAFNPEKARHLLVEAGYPRGSGFPGFEIVYPTREQNRKTVEAIQAMWVRELGISITLTNTEWKVYLTETEQMQYDMCTDGWSGDLSPYSLLHTMMSESPNNMTGYADPEYDRLLVEATHTVDKESRMALYRQAEIRMMDYQSLIPLYWDTRIFLIDPRVRNWNPKFTGRQLKIVYLEE